MVWEGWRAILGQRWKIFWHTAGQTLRQWTRLRGDYNFGRRSLFPSLLWTDFENFSFLSRKVFWKCKIWLPYFLGLVDFQPISKTSLGLILSIPRQSKIPEDFPLQNPHLEKQRLLGQMDFSFRFLRFFAASI